MSIDSPPAKGQDPAHAPPASLEAQELAAIEETEAPSLRIFICYPTKALKDVARFEPVLIERLGPRGRNYRVFRDQGTTEEERINPTDEWRETIWNALDNSVCCIVILVPSTFQSEECAKEVERFQGLIENEKARKDKTGSDKVRGRFFLPIEFLDVRSQIKQLADEQTSPPSPGTRIARIIKNYQYFDFRNFPLKKDDLEYAAKVDEIADRIHRAIDKTIVRRPTTAEGGGGESRAVRRRPSIVVATLISALVVIGLGVLIWPRPPEPVIVRGPPLDQTLETVLPLPLRAAPTPEATELETLQPGKIKAGEGEVVEIHLVTVNNKQWYEIDLAGGKKGYVESQRLPTWNALPANMDLIKEVEARKMPMISLPKVRTLAPGSLALSRKFGVHSSAKLEDLLWYRIAQADFPVYFSEQDGAGALVEWMPMTDCLRAKRSFSIRTAVKDGRELEQYVMGETLRGQFQIARTAGDGWIRYPRADGTFGYLQADDAEPCASR